MNELFEKIATEVFFDESTNGAGQKMYMFGDQKMQKFAELIVQECLYLCESTAAGQDAEAIQEAIKQHFGVKR